MRCPLAMPGSILESSWRRDISRRRPQFQLDEAVHFDRVTRWGFASSPPRRSPGRPFGGLRPSSRHGTPCRRSISSLTFRTDPSWRSPRPLRLEFDRGGGLGAGLRIEHQRRPIDARFTPVAPGSTRTAECKVVRPPPRTMPRLMIIDRVRGRGGPSPRRRLRVDPFPRGQTPNEFRRGAGTEEIRRGIFQVRRSQVRVDPFEGSRLRGRAARFRDEVVHRSGESSGVRCTHAGSGHGDDLDGGYVQLVRRVDGRGASLDVRHVGAAVGHNQVPLERLGPSRSPRGSPLAGESRRERRRAHIGTISSRAAWCSGDWPPPSPTTRTS